MANQEQLAILQLGANAWNKWMYENSEDPDFTIDLTHLKEAAIYGVDLRGVNFQNADLSMAELSGSDLRGSIFNNADLVGADLHGTDLEEAKFIGADLHEAHLSMANFFRAILEGADLRRADLNRANLSEAKLVGANLNDAYLHNAMLRKSNLIDTVLNGANLEGADLSYAKLNGANLNNTYLVRVNFEGADLSDAKLNEAISIEANFINAILRKAVLNGANLRNANLKKASFEEAKLEKANLSDANLNGTLLINADLENSNLNQATLVKTNFEGANIKGCNVYGISAWDLILKDARQEGLVISSINDPTITVDNLEIAQFIHLLLNHEKIREAINSMTKKGVLILGRFGQNGLEILESIAIKLREMKYLPIIFNFNRPDLRDHTETIITLAGLSRFVIVDLSGPSVPQELYSTIPNFAIPFVPIIEEGRNDYFMFQDLFKFNWVLRPIIEFKNKEHLLSILPSRIVWPAEQKCRERLEELDRLFNKKSSFSPREAIAFDEVKLMTYVG